MIFDSFERKFLDIRVLSNHPNCGTNVFKAFPNEQMYKSVLDTDLLRKGPHPSNPHNLWWNWPIIFQTDEQGFSKDS